MRIRGYSLDEVVGLEIENSESAGESRSLAERMRVDWQVRTVLHDGVIAGAVAATGVVLWYLVGDVAVGLLFFTPRLVGYALARGLGLIPLMQSGTGVVMLYMTFHFAAFIAIGIALSAIMHRAGSNSAVLAAALLSIVVAAAGIYGANAVIGDATPMGVLVRPRLLMGNVIGCVILGVQLWRSHHSRWGELRDE